MADWIAAMQVAFDRTTAECNYLRGDDCQKTRSWLIGYASSSFRDVLDRHMTEDEEAEMVRRLGEWLVS